MSVDMNAPELRFSGYSEKWKVNKFNRLTKINQGLQIEISNRYTYKVDNSFFYITNEFLKESSGYKYFIVNPPASVLCNEDDVLMTRTGNTGHVVTNISGAFHNNFFKINFDRKELDKNFLVHYLKWSKTQQTILRVAGSSTIPDLNHNDFYSLKIAYSKIEEQTKVGNTFEKLDSLINQHQQKHDKLSNIKKAMLEKMFPKEGESIPEIRFKEFSEKWEQKELDELAEIVRGASPRPIEDPKWFDTRSNVGWLRIRDVTEQDGRIFHLEQRISRLGQEKTRVLYEKHLLLSIAASVGKPVVNYVETGVHDGFLIFKKPLFEIEFMYQWLKSFESQWQQYGQPGSQVNLNSDIVKHQLVYVPSKEEQTAIGDYFQKLDAMINQHQRQITKLNNIKQACLKKMFV
ncbi:restriction endonuclease subunit S [Pseudoalteromonas sp. B62]|uniref:restriction endonuclease subunit S n=1 Tax=Pseudoalteromonas sp. B62 TaxID=630483 RepID=UPI00301C881D